MDNSELFELILRIAGQEKVNRLTADLEASERGMADLMAASNLMGRALPIQELAVFANKIASTKAELAKAQAALDATANAEKRLAEKADQAAAKAEATAQRKAQAAERAAQRQEAAAERAARAAERQAQREAAAAERATKAIQAREAREAIASGRASSIGGRAQAEREADLAETRRVVADDRAAYLGSRLDTSDASIARGLKRAGKVAGKADDAFDAARAGAKARLGLGLANMAQDTIQGGSPAYAINNVLGMAGDGGVKALAGEALAAVGGIKAIGAAFGTVAIAAGAAFAVIDHGLKSQKLGWGDLGEVVENITGGVIETSLKNISGILADTFKPLGDLTNQALDYWLGWDDAAAKVRAHKEEIERSTAAMEKLKESQKTLAGFKSDVQEEKEGRDKIAAKELANLGGEGGAVGLAKTLAGYRMAAAGLDPDQKAEYEYDEKSKEDGKEVTRRVKRTMTRREAAEVTATNDLADALNGDAEKREKVLADLELYGDDTSRVRGAIAGRDFEKEAKEAAKAKEKEAKEADKREADNLNREAREGEKAWEDSLKEARRSKSFVGKKAEDMTPAEKEAKREFDAQESAVSEATRDRSWLGKEDEELSPAEKIARKRSDDRERAEDDRIRGIKGANPELGTLLAESLQGTLQLGGDMEAARKALFDRVASSVGTDAARSLVDDATGDARKGYVNSLLNQRDAMPEAVRVIQGGAALRDSIQSEVKPDDGWKRVVEKLDRTNQLLEDFGSGMSLG